MQPLTKAQAKLLLYLLIVCAFFVSGISCAPSKRKMTIEAGQIPPGFKGFNGTLLIIDGNQRSWNKYVTKHFDKYYKGKYEIVKQKELFSTFIDVVSYRFVLYRVGGSGSEQLCLFDRALEAKFCSKVATNFAILIKNYSISLERARSGK